MANFCSQCGKPLQPNSNFCTACGAPLTGSSRGGRDLKRKREQVLGNQQGKRRATVQKVIGGSVVLIFGGWLFINNLPSKANPIIEAQATVSSAAKYPKAPTRMFDVPAKVENGKITIPLDVVVQKKFVAFDYVGKAAEVPLLAYISGEGKLVTGVSMCEPCNSRRFHIKGDELVCNTCGSTWELDNLSPISGACGRFPPDAIPSSVVGNEIQIDEAAVANWRPRI